MYDNPHQNMDDKFFIQKIYINFEKASPRWYLANQLSSISFRWTLFKCQFRSNIISKIIWPTYDYLTFTHHGALQPLDVSYFKSFKKKLKNEKDDTIIKNNQNEPNKTTFVGQVDKALDLALSKRNIKNGF